MIEYLPAYLFIGYVWSSLVVLYDKEVALTFVEPLSLFDLVWYSVQIVFWPVCIISFIGYKTKLF